MLDFAFYLVDMGRKDREEMGGACFCSFQVYTFTKEVSEAEYTGNVL